jgi:hypothetical protein
LFARVFTIGQTPFLNRAFSLFYRNTCGGLLRGATVLVDGQEMNAVSYIGSGPTVAEIRASVDHIFASPGFRRSPQLVSFLRFVVETTLAGKAASIKSYSIGVEALGRREDFEPDVDPIVRVEAGRLRRALVCYYASDGAGHPIVVEIPLGHYVPIFYYRKYPYLASKLAAIVSRQPVKLIDVWTRSYLHKWVGGLGRRDNSSAS